MGFTKYILEYIIQADGKQAKAEIKSVETAYGKIHASAAGVQKGAKEAASEISNIVSALTGDRLTGAASQVTSLANAFGAIPGPVGIAVGSVAAFGVAVVGVGGALFELTKKASEYGSVIHDASDKTGLHAETLSAMDVAAKQSGTSLESVTNSIQKFAQTVGQAAEGSDKAKKSLIALGIDPQKAVNDLGGALGQVFKKIADAKTPVEQNTLAFQAFGKQGKELLPFIKQFDGDLPGLIKKMKELGVTISDQDAVAADEFGDQMSLVTDQLEKAGMKIGTAFMPQFYRLATSLSEWVAKNQDEITTWADKFAFAFGRVITGAEVVVSKLETIWAGYRKFMESIGLGFVFALPDTLNADYAASLKGKPRDSVGYNPSIPGGDLPDVYGKGPKKPPHETDDQFRKFFTDQGFSVTRTFGDALNKNSLHPLGLAADISVRGKSTDEIGKLIAAAIEKGYRLVDERKKIPGVYQTGPHLHFERNGSDKASIFQDQSYYGGTPVGYFQHLDAQRRGKVAGGKDAVNEYTKKQADDQRKADEETLAVLRDGLDKEIALQQSHYETMQLMLDKSVAEGVITEESANKAKEKLDLDFLNFKLGKLNEEAAQVEGNAKEESRVAQEQALLLETIEQTKAKNEAKRYADEKKRNDERNKSWSDYVHMIEQANDAQAEADDRNAAQKRQARLQHTIGSGQTPDAFSQLRDYFVNQDSTGMIAGVDAMTEAFSRLGSAVGSAVAAFVLYGNAGTSVRQVTAQILASIAQQAAVQAIYELAQGLAVLALAFFGVPNAGPSATAHFAAAAMYGTIAGVTAGLGRAVAGNSFNKGSGGGGKGKGTGSATATGAYSYGSGNGANPNPTPYSRVSDDAYISGSRDHQARFVADAIKEHTETLKRMDAKIGAMKPGEVLSRGIQQSPGAIGHAVIKDTQRNSSIGTNILKAAGQRR